MATLDETTDPRADLEYWIKRAAHWERLASEARTDKERLRLIAEAEFAMHAAIRAEEQTLHG